MIPLLPAGSSVTLTPGSSSSTLRHWVCPWIDMSVGVSMYEGAALTLIELRADVVTCAIVFIPVTGARAMSRFTSSLSTAMPLRFASL